MILKVIAIISSPAWLHWFSSQAAITAILAGVVHIIRAQLDDRVDAFLINGSLTACPLHVTIDEARQLSPRCPFDVVLFIGFHDRKDDFRDKAIIKVAQCVSPNLQFQRPTRTDPSISLLP